MDLKGLYEEFLDREVKRVESNREFIRKIEAEIDRRLEQLDVREAHHV